MNIVFIYNYVKKQNIWCTIHHESRELKYDLCKLYTSIANT